MKKEKVAKKPVKKTVKKTADKSKDKFFKLNVEVTLKDDDIDGLKGGMHVKGMSNSEIGVMLSTISINMAKKTSSPTMVIMTMIRCLMKVL